MRLNHDTFQVIIFSVAFVVAAYRSQAGEPIGAPRIFPDSSPPAAEVYLVDVNQVSADQKLLLATLQGLVNSGATSQLYLDTNADSGTPQSFWLSHFHEVGQIEKITEFTPSQAVSHFSDCISQVIMYDPQVPATINVATMLASVSDGVVSSPEEVVNFVGLREKPQVDLRGNWDSDLAAYQWASKELLPKLSDQVIAILHPEFNQHRLRDYLVRHKVFHFWISGLDSKLAAEQLEFAKTVFKKFDAGTPVLGWVQAGETDPGSSEYEALELIGSFGHFLVPTDWSANLSFLSGMQPSTALAHRNEQRSQASLSPAAMPSEKNVIGGKHCISLVIQDSGDSPNYLQSVMKEVWDDPSRGKVPIAWTISPGALELCPGVVDWFVANASTGDDFYLGFSGLGYTHPYRNFLSKRAHPKQLLSKQLLKLNQIAEAYGFDTLAVYTDAWRVFDREKHDTLTKQLVEGLPAIKLFLLGMGRDENAEDLGFHYFMESATEKDAAIISHVIGRWDANHVRAHSEQNFELLVAEIQQFAETNQSTQHFFVHPLSWTFYPSDLLKLKSRLGDSYKVLSVQEMQNLLRSSSIQ